jgi:thymidylate synthase (FAD)
MRVTLLWHTPQPERMIALAMRRCYSSKPIEDIDSELQSKQGYEKELVKRAIRDKTFDVIEHAVFMFEIEGISRVCSHQLVRHRIASYDQESQRFSAVDKESFIVPPSVKSKREALEVFNKASEVCLDAFKKLKDFGIPKEDARFILPQSIGTKLVLTINARSLMHILWQREAPQAQWEIRELARLMHEEARKVAPTLFAEIFEV